jgi:hypothetical protein
MRRLLVLVTWLLIAPPTIREAGMGRMDDRQPLWMWQRLGEFADAPTCRRFRDDQVAATYGRDDTAWARFSLARCFRAARAAGGRLSALDDDWGS